jgi:hypothetical protein
MSARLPFDAPMLAALGAARETDEQLPRPATAGGGEIGELVAIWNGSVLDVRHFDRGRGSRPFRLGERPDCDVRLPLERLGGKDDVCLVRPAGGRLVCTLLPGAEGTLRRADGVELSLAELERGGRTAASDELPGARELVLDAGERLRLEYGEFTFHAHMVPRAKLALAAKREWTALGFIAGSLVLHVAFMALAWQHAEAPAGLKIDSIVRDAGYLQMISLVPPQAVELDQIVLEEEAEKARQQEQDKQVEDTLVEEPDDDDGGQGARTVGDEGRMGERTARDEDKMGGVRGEANNPDPHMARTKIIEQVMSTGAVAALQQLDSRAPTSPFSPYSTALGNDPVDARGHLMGSEYGDAYGNGGLGMFGNGNGGGGSSYHTFGLGVDGMGHGYGTGPGTGFGREAGDLGRSRAGESRSFGPELRGRTGEGPEIRFLEATTFGGLSKETIQRILRTHRSRIRHCYEIALRESSDVTGRVTVGFVIAPQGNVQSAETRANTTESDALARCILGVVERINFPQADGITACTYPFLLQTAGSGE